MPAATFDELFEKSVLFRNLFVGKERFFPDKNNFDKDKAKKLWALRKPFVDWNFCQHEGCVEIVKDGDSCGKHCSGEKGLPLWRWIKRTLYRLMWEEENVDAARRTGKHGYQDFLRFQARRKFGNLPFGFEPVHINGNLLDFSRENVALISKVSMCAVREGVLSINDAFVMDELIAPFIMEKCRAGRKPFGTIIGYGDIALASNMLESTVRKHIQNGALNPKKLSSIVKFVNNTKKVDNQIQ